MQKRDHLKNIQQLLANTNDVQYQPQDSDQYEDIVSVFASYSVTPQQIYSLACIAIKLKCLIGIGFQHKTQIIQEASKIKTLETLGVHLIDHFNYKTANEYLVNISKWNYIKNLILYGDTLHIDDFKTLATMNQLETLQLHEFCEFNNSQKFALLGSLKNMKSFAFIQTQQSEFGNQVKVIIQTLPFLQQLKIVHTSLKPEHLVGLCAFSKLKHLNLNYTCQEQQDEQQQQILRIIQQLNKLETLQLAWYKVSESNLLYWKQNFNFLRNLNLEGCEIYDNKVSILSQMNKIVILNIQRNRMNVENVYLIVSNNINIKKLTITLSQHQSRSIMCIAKFLTNLQSLTISFQMRRQLFINNGLIYLKYLKKLRSLQLNKVLSVSHNLSACMRNYKHIKKMNIDYSNQNLKQIRQNNMINRGCSFN